MVNNITIVYIQLNLAVSWSVPCSNTELFLENYPFRPYQPGNFSVHLPGPMVDSMDPGKRTKSQHCLVYLLPSRLERDSAFVGGTQSSSVTFAFQFLV